MLSYMLKDSVESDAFVRLTMVIEGIEKQSRRVLIQLYVMRPKRVRNDQMWEIAKKSKERWG